MKKKKQLRIIGSYCSNFTKIIVGNSNQDNSNSPLTRTKFVSLDQNLPQQLESHQEYNPMHQLFLNLQQVRSAILFCHKSIFRVSRVVCEGKLKLKRLPIAFFFFDILEDTLNETTEDLATEKVATIIRRGEKLKFDFRGIILHYKKGHTCDLRY